MKLSKLIFAVSLIAAGSLSGNVLAQEHKGPGFERGQHERHAPMKRMLADLDLTDSQREKIKLLMEEQREAFKPEKPDNAVHDKMQALLLAKKFDESAAKKLLEQQQQQAVERKLKMLKLEHEVLQVLTDEQRQQLAEKREKMQQKRQERKERREP